mmetsp:Transcript_17988/g.34043  ORF Transcript_17988/g.34043 Transcript_17988/m.34043 type:complete len:237 (-) Transcript_17988:498-1208(-)
MARLCWIILLCAIAASTAFVLPPSNTYDKQRSFATFAKKNSGDDVAQKQALPIGALVEFEEKGRVHIGKVIEVMPKSNGANRYDILDHEGLKFKNVGEKEINFATPVQKSASAEQKLMADLVKTQEESTDMLLKDLGVSTDLLEMAWMEAASEGTESNELTPDSFFSMIHSKAASMSEKYKAWRLLKTDLARVFFKDLKQNGRVVAFKAKAEDTVEAAKRTFCSSDQNQSVEFCFV